MATLNEMVGGAPPDELLRLTGTTNGSFYETITASGVSSGINLGATAGGRIFEFRAVAATTPTGATATLVLGIQDSADGTTYTTQVSFTTFNITNTYQVGATASNALSVSPPPRIVFRVQKDRPYIRLIKAPGGSTGTYTMAVIANPIMDVGV